MTKEELQGLVNQIHDHCTRLLFEKNSKYADSIDCFTNFKARNNYLKTRKSILGAQLDSAAKHIVAIPDCVAILDANEGKVTADNMDKAQQLFESLSDVVSYSYLMLAELSAAVALWNAEEQSNLAKAEDPIDLQDYTDEEYTSEEIEEEVNPREEDFLKKILRKDEGD